MRTDISKNTFRLDKNYSSVRRQQGRVDLDADWNEQADIQNNRARILTVDSLGPVGAPQNDAGFMIAPSGDSADLTVSAGRFYIDGVLVNNTSEFNVSAQPDLPGIALPSADGNYLAYLKVHERSVTALEAPEIREIALGGPDTTTRTQVMRQVLLTAVTETDIDSRTIPADWNTIVSRNPGRMSARTQADDAGSDPCAVGARGGYTGLDNLLYRVEIHDAGAAGTATYKWSRDNGALVTEWLEQDGNILSVRSTGNDNVLNFAPGQWVEIIDDGLELEGKPGTLAQILRVEGRRITINPDNIQHFPGSAGTLDINEFSRGVRKIRRWDMVGQVNPPAVPDGAGGEVWITLENGIEVKFDDLASGREYRVGDYWMFAARANINNIEWACDNNGNIEHDPHGTYFYYARLAFVNLTAGAWTVIADAREIFPGLTDEELAYVGGDGQLSVPGQILDRPLEVRVTRGATPVPDAKVRFTVTNGTGTIEDAPGGTSGTTLDIKADSEGVARVYWTLLDAVAGQSIRAVLLDEANAETPLYVVFGAGSGVASGIQYTPISTDSSVAGTTNVQEALDALADNKVNRSGDTMTGNLTVNADLEVTGNMTIRGDVIARDAQQQAGDVLLGDDDVDRVIIHGTLQSNHTSGSLEIEGPVHMRTTDPTKSPLRVDGPTTGGSPRLYRIPLDLDHTNASATTLNDYQLLFIVDTATPIAAGRMQTDGDDILFEDQDGTLLPFWIESDMNTANTRIWVRVPTITAGANRTVYILYGNNSAIAQSSSAATFVREIPGHVLAYNFDEGSGTTTTDYSGNGQDGTINGATYVAGLHGQALDFDGTTNVVSSTVTWPSIGTGDFSISMWHRPELIVGDSRVLLSDETLLNFQLNLHSAGELVLHLGNSATISSPVAWVLNTWHHIAAVRSAGQVTLYVDGAPVHSEANAGNISASTLIDIGYRTSDNQHPVDGQIDEVRILNRALNSDEINDQANNAPYLSVNNLGVELLRRTPALEPVITAQAEEANPLSETPILFAQETSGNVGIGTDSPDEKLSVDGIIETKTGGIKFPDGTIQTTAGGPGGSGGEPLPLGTIMAWHRDFAGAPAIPDGWVECNGQILSDVDSPYDGLVIPNLNGEKRFLRGGDASGTMQDDAFQGHWHSPDFDQGIELSVAGGGQGGTPGTGFLVGTGPYAARDAVDDGTHGTPRVDSETRPINMSVVWIMKIKETGEAGLWTPNDEGIHFNAGKVSVGTDVTDEQLTVTGAISLEEKVLEPDTTDDFGKIYVRENDLSHLTLNGMDQYVSMPALGNASVGDFTISIWFRVRRQKDVPNDRSYLVSMRGDGTELASGAMLILDDGPNGITYISPGAVWPTGGGSEFRLDVGNITGEWHHLALVREGVAFRAYFDGRFISNSPLVSGSPKTDLLDWNSPWRLGTYSNQTSAGDEHWHHGDLDDLGLWTRALSDDELATLHQSGRGSDIPTAFASSLLAYYPMSQSATAGQLDDVSGNNLHGTIQNGGSITPERVGSLYFKDGFGNVTSLAGGGDSYRTGGSGNQVPLGTIMAWHKSFANTPAIPDGWVECNGQTLDDPVSPYHGQTIPDLNNPKESWNSKGSFLRGDTQSGDFEDDQFQGHIHNTSGVPEAIGDIAAPGGPGSNVWVSTTTRSTGGPVQGSNGAPRVGDETMPVNMSVVWIMKIRETDRDRGLWRENGEDIYFDDGKVGVGANSANAKLHISANDLEEAPLRVDAKITLQGIQGRLYRSPINLDNTDTNDIADKQIAITLDTAALVSQGKMRFDGADILFTDTDGKTILPHLIESGMNSAATKMWVRVPLIAAGESRNVFMQYGKSDATLITPEAVFPRDNEISGVVLAWNFEEGSGSVVADSSGTEKTGNSSGTWIPGYRGNAINFSGTQGVSSVAAHTWGFSSTVTVSAWIRATTTNAASTILSIQHGTINDEVLFTVLPSGLVHIYNHNAANVYANRRSISNVLTGNWVHVVGILEGPADGTQYRIFVNGVREDGAISTSGAPFLISDATPRTASVGSRPGTGEYFIGDIDQVRVYDHALTDSQVANIYALESLVVPELPGRELLYTPVAVPPTITVNGEEPNPVSGSPVLFAQNLTGNIGIGTDEPAAKLHIAGEAGVDGIMFPDGSLQTTAGGGGGGDSTPLGTIIAWHKNLSGTPAIPEGWVECNGQVLSDGDSPFDGQVIPNLNGDERFLRGGNTSGTLQDDQFQRHWHRVYPHAGTETGELPIVTTGAGGGDALTQVALGLTGSAQAPPVPTSSGAPRQGDETRPINMSVVWIMKVKQVGGQSGLWTPAGEGIHYAEGKVSVGTTTADEQLTVSGAISLEEKILEPDTTDDFGKIYVRENDLSHLRLNGSNQYVSMPSLGNNAVGDFTVGLWFRLRNPNTGNTGNHSYFLDLRGDSSELSKSLAYRLTNTVEGDTMLDHFLEWPSGSSSAFQLNIGNVLDEWHHAAVTREGNILRCYHDGRLLSDAPTTSAAKTDPLDWAHAWRLGTYELAAANDYFFHGDLDDLGLWERALSSDEIAALHNGGRGSDVPTAFASSLVAFYPMTESATAGQLDDVSGNDFHGTIQNGASVVPEKVGSLYFKDGFGNVTALAGGGDSYRTGGSGNQVPVGTIMAWHKSFTNTPAIPDGWVECNGQPLDDPASPYHGQTIPDLNNPNNAWNNKGSFLRGDLVSGDFEEDRMQGHLHGYQQVSTQLSTPGAIVTGAGFLPHIGNNSSGPVSDGSNGTPRVGPETKPVNMSVVWIMKVRETDRDRGLWREQGEDIYFDDGNVGVGARTATAKVHISAEDSTEAPLRIDAQTTLQGVQGRLYRSGITLDNTDTTDLIDHQVAVTLDTQALVSAGKMRFDGGDILFVDTDGKTILPHFIESGMNTATTKIWVRVPAILAGANRLIFVQYGKADAVTPVNGAAFSRDINGVALAFNFDEGAGNTTADQGPNARTLVGTVGWTTGYRGNAVNLNGGQSMSTGAHNWGFSAEGTISAWIRTTQVHASGRSTIVTIQHGSLNDEMLLTINADGTVSIFSHNSGGVFAQITTTSTVLTGDWIHVVGVLQGGVDAVNYRLYINGVNDTGSIGIGGAPFPISDATPRAVTVGGRNSSEHFIGDIDLVRVYDHALTEQEVADMFANESLLSATYPGHELLYKPAAVDPSVVFAAEEPNPVSGSPIFFAQNLTGNIGIGTDDPQNKLHIAGTAGVDGIVFPDGTLQTTAGSANGGDSTPIGTIIAWHKSLSGTPPIPLGWVECNGQTLDDIDSPYHNLVIPDLNNPKESWNAKGSFLRGDSTSGTFEDDAFQGHWHRLEMGRVRSADSGSFDAAWDRHGNVVEGDDMVRDARTDGVNGAPRTDAETRPVNMTVVWIIKVRQTDSSAWLSVPGGLAYSGGDVGIGTTQLNSKLTIDGALSLSESTPAPSETLGFGKIYARENSIRHLEFDGTGDFVSMPPLGETGVGDFTISLWFKMNAHNPLGTTYLADWRNLGASDGPWLIVHDDGADGALFNPGVTESGSGVHHNYKVGDITSQWHHAAFVREGSATRSYLDGVLVSDIPNIGSPGGVPFNLNHAWRLGIHTDTPAAGQEFWLNGSLSQIAIWKRPLAGFEMAAVYSGGREIDLMQDHSTQIVGYWPVDSGDGGTTLNDHSGNNNHGTLQGDVSFASENAGTLLYKDGQGTTSLLAGSRGFPRSVASTGREVPLGTIMAWHKSFTGTPAMPPGWVECNGQVLSDGESPYNGETIPNLNGDPAGADSPDLADKKSMFLRGGLTSGAGQDDAFQGHHHDVPPGDIIYQTGSIGSGNIQTGPSGGSATETGAAITDGTNGTPRTADETRPVNMTVVWIMKIKHTGTGAWESVSSGVSFLGGRVGIGTNFPETSLHVDGYVTKQNVAFTAENTTTFINDGSEAILTYGNISTNTGGGFQGDNQTFAAPVAGTYVFSVHYSADPGASGNDQSKIMTIHKTDIDTSAVTVIGTARSGQSAGNQRDTVSLTITAELKQGDVIDTRSSAAAGSALHFLKYYFSGWRL